MAGLNEVQKREVQDMITSQMREAMERASAEVTFSIRQEVEASAEKLREAAEEFERRD